MPLFGDNVGIRFREIMSGHISAGATDPTEGERIGRKKNERFEFDIVVEIPRLAAYLAGPQHVATLPRGEIRWKKHAKRAAIEAGKLVMFRPGTRPGEKHFDFIFAFKDEKGRRHVVHGDKVLAHDRRFGDAAQDMSTLAVTLRDEAATTTLGAGITHVHVGELLEQLASMEVTGATSKDEERAARRAFLGFLNGRNAEIYPGLPVLFPEQEDSPLRPAERRAIGLCADVILPSDPALRRLTPAEVVDQVEKFLTLASSREIEPIRKMLGVLGSLDALLRFDRDALRSLVEKHLFHEDRNPIRDAFELLHLVVNFSYFSHPKVDTQVGYRRFAPRVAPNAARLPVHDVPPAGSYDVVIAGSGPAGSVLAARLTAKGKRVLLLEAGPYVPEPTITDDEVSATAQLYKEAGLQRANDKIISKHRSMLVLQGACLGGGSMVNNAICFRLPTARLGEWHAIGFPVTAAELDLGYADVARDLGIIPISQTGAKLNPTGTMLAGTFGAPRIHDSTQPPVPGFFECNVNIAGAPKPCLGCGYCNLACAFERKRNALQVYLPAALATGLCTIVHRATVTDIHLSKKKPGQLRRTVEAFSVTLGDGRVVKVQAKEYILSAGAVGSSVALLRSKDVASLKLPVGEGFSANVGSPVYAFYDAPLSSFDGLQIGHYYMPPSGRFVAETWFNPPGTQAMAIPGFLDAHFNRMLRYANIATAAPLVGTGPIGRIELAGKSTNISLPLGDDDLARIREGLKDLSRAFLRGAGGRKPREVILSTRTGLVLQDESELTHIDRIEDISELSVGTGHPQGGNAMTKDKKRSVVDAQFLVRGTANLRVCDGSVFPTSTSVNPQWTIMAAAHHCAAGMV